MIIPKRAAEQAGLSKRETVVFLLMVQGKSIAQIDDELFIAQGTVRGERNSSSAMNVVVLPRAM